MTEANTTIRLDLNQVGGLRHNVGNAVARLHRGIRLNREFLRGIPDQWLVLFRRIGRPVHDNLAANRPSPDNHLTAHIDLNGHTFRRDSAAIHRTHLKYHAFRNTDCRNRHIRTRKRMCIQIEINALRQHERRSERNIGFEIHLSVIRCGINSRLDSRVICLARLSRHRGLRLDDTTVDKAVTLRHHRIRNQDHDRRQLVTGRINRRSDAIEVHVTDLRHRRKERIGVGRDLTLVGHLLDLLGVNARDDFTVVKIRLDRQCRAIGELQLRITRNRRCSDSTLHQHVARSVHRHRAEAPAARRIIER